MADGGHVFQAGRHRLAAQGDSRGDQHGGSDHLTDNRPPQRVQSCHAQIAAVQAFIDDGGLLIEHRPRHHAGAQIGGDQIEKIPIAERQMHALPQHLRPIRMRRPGDDQKAQFAQAEQDRDLLHTAIAGAEHHGEDHHGGCPHALPRWNAEHLADARQPAHLGDERAQAGDHQGCHTQPGPDFAEMAGNQLAMPAPGAKTEADGELLHHVEHRDQHELQAEQPIAPLRSGLGGGDHAARIGVGQHHHQPRTEGEQDAHPGRRWTHNGFAH